MQFWRDQTFWEEDVVKWETSVDALDVRSWVSTPGSALTPDCDEILMQSLDLPGAASSSAGEPGCWSQYFAPTDLAVL